MSTPTFRGIWRKLFWEGLLIVHLISREELISGSQQPVWLLQELFCDLKIKIAPLNWN